MTDGRTGWVLGGRYRVIERIGAGGMAEVFRAHDETLARDVAIKVFRSDASSPATGGTAGADRRGLELQALARLNHPNLITLYDGSMSSNPSYLVMELVEGEDLADRLERGPLPPGQVREIGAQIASALTYVHSRGLAHRDVKPANILLGRDGRARLSDFGIVRLIGSPRVTSADLTVGTASYLAPEQARGGDVGAGADVYSLGLVLIETFTGVRCFDGPVIETMAARLTRAPDVPSNLPPPWPQLLTAMTSIDPAGRPTAAQVTQTLQGAGSAPPVAPADATTAYRGPVVTPIPGAGVGSTSAMPMSSMPPVRRPHIPDTPPPMPVDPGPGQPSAWRPVAIALGLLAVLAIAGVVAFAVASNNSSDSPGAGPSFTDSAQRTAGSSSRSHSSSQSSSDRKSSSRKRSKSHSSSEKKTPPKSHSHKSSKSSGSSSSKSSAKSSSSSSSSSSKSNGNETGNGNGGDQGARN